MYGIFECRFLRVEPDLRKAALGLWLTNGMMSVRRCDFQSGGEGSENRVGSENGAGRNMLTSV
jgi:hypothetical protein